MTNDLSTLNGALLEMKDQLIYELGQKGVTASYDSSTGLLGLIGEISNIQTGGGVCYSLELDQSSYTTGGVLTVSATLLSAYDDSPISGATVTFTSNASTTTTATTDTTGVATATITFSDSTTLTATYGSATDTATVTKYNYIFYDPCTSSSGLSNYGTPVNLYQSTPHTYSLSYDSTENAYAYYGSSNFDYYLFPISALDGESSFTLSAEFNVKNAGTSAYVGLAVMGDEADLSTVKANVWRARNNGSTTLQTIDNEIYRTGTSTKTWNNNTFSTTDWLRLKVTFNGTDGYSATFETIDGTTIRTYTGTVNPSISDRQYGFFVSNTDTSSEILYIKNIKAERSV